MVPRLGREDETKDVEIVASHSTRSSLDARWAVTEVFVCEYPKHSDRGLDPIVHRRKALEAFDETESMLTPLNPAESDLLYRVSVGY